MYARSATLILAAALVAIATGCGSGDSGTARSQEPSWPPPLATSRLGRAQFVKHVNVECARLRGDRVRSVQVFVKGVPRKDGETNSDVIVRAIKEVVVPVFQVQDEELRELGAPPGDKEQMQAILTAYERATKIGTELKGIEEKGRLERSFRRASQMARNYGLKQCVIDSVDEPF